MCIPILCPTCNADVEHLLHLFFDCGYAKKCWEEAGLSYDMRTVEDASHWLLERLSTEMSEKLIIIAKVLWGIWFGRKKKVWDSNRDDSFTRPDGYPTRSDPIGSTRT